MKCCVLFASPRGERSNTRVLLAEFLDVWRSAGHDAVCHSLYEETISPCVACRGCQRDWSGPNCVIDDDMTAVLRIFWRAICCCWPVPSICGAAPHP